MRRPVDAGRRTVARTSSGFAILLSVLLLPALALGAGRLSVQNISSREYGAAGANWAVFQSRQGLLYVGGDAGVTHGAKLVRRARALAATNR